MNDRMGMDGVTGFILRMNGWIDWLINGWMDGWINEWMGMDERMVYFQN